MGLLSGVTGHLGDASVEDVTREIGALLFEGERVEAALKGVRDLHVFTNRRLIVVDKQGLRGKEAEYVSIPYRSVHRFSTENPGTFDMDSELKIWLTGQAEPISLEIGRGADIAGVQRALAAGVCR
jgi:hypothetical protein